MMSLSLLIRSFDKKLLQYKRSAAIRNFGAFLFARVNFYIKMFAPYVQTMRIKLLGPGLIKVCRAGLKSIIDTKTNREASRTFFVSRDITFSSSINYEPTNRPSRWERLRAWSKSVCRKTILREKLQDLLTRCLSVTMSLRAWSRAVCLQCRRFPSHPRFPPRAIAVVSAGSLTGSSRPCGCLGHKRKLSAQVKCYKMARLLRPSSPPRPAGASNPSHCLEPPRKLSTLRRNPLRLRILRSKRRQQKSSTTRSLLLHSPHVPLDLRLVPRFQPPTLPLLPTPSHILVL
jgi:hypothetical protein